MAKKSDSRRKPSIYKPEYIVRDGGPGDDDGKKDGNITYTTYLGPGPIAIAGLRRYARKVLGLSIPKGVPDLLYSFEDVNSIGAKFTRAVWLYTYGHFDRKTGTVEPASPGAMLVMKPGDSLTINTEFLLNIGKTPESAVGGVGFVEGGGAGSSNTHFHGTNSSPKGYGDNVDVEYRSNFSNTIKLPKSHHEGLSWWHPHYHSSANSQVYGGGFGNLQIGDSLKNIPGFEKAKQSYIGIKNFNLFYNQQTARIEVKTSEFTPEDTARNINLLNGEFQPTKSGYKTGEWNSFSFINYTSNSYYNVKIVRAAKSKKFDVNDKSTWGPVVDQYIYGKDGYQSRDIEKAYTGINNTILNGLQLEDPVGNVTTPLPTPDLENNLFMSPARRFETLAYFQKPGDYKIISEAWTGAGLRAGGWIWPNMELGTLKVGGKQVGAPAVLPDSVEPKIKYPSIGVDLGKYEPLRERRITWSGNLFVEGPNRYRKINGGIYNTNKILANGRPNRYAGYSTPFLINDNVLPYNPALITQLDTLEYWNQENWASEQHPFHPHQNHFQIVEPQDAGPTDRVEQSAAIPDSANARSLIQLFIGYLGRLPNPKELERFLQYCKSGECEDNIVQILTYKGRVTGDNPTSVYALKDDYIDHSKYDPDNPASLGSALRPGVDLNSKVTYETYGQEFQRFYITERDVTQDPFLQVADGAYYTIARENIFSKNTSIYWGNYFKENGIEALPIEMIRQFRAGKEGPAFAARLENLSKIGLYAINQVATKEPLESVATALLRMLGQQVNGNPASVTRLYSVIDDALKVDPNALVNGEHYYGSRNRLDTIALPAGMIKTQSFSSPSANRYPAPASYNEWNPGRITTATTFDNFTGGFLQHCHILPHEDTGQAVIVKTIDNMQRSWFSSKKEYAPGEEITIFRSSDYKAYTLKSKPKVGTRIAFGDVNKDGYVDIIRGEGDGGSDKITILDGRDLSVLGKFRAFGDRTWKYGVHLDVNDLTGDGLNDIAIGAGKGGGSRLNVFSNSTNGFQFAGSVTPFQSSKKLRDNNETRFTLGDFDVDNFVDIAFMGSSKKGNAVEVRSSRDGTVLSVFKTGLQGKVSLSAGFSSYNNLGLETLVMAEDTAKSAIVQTATMRAAMYVAHSNVDDNPYYDAAKYFGNIDSDEQVMLTQPAGRLSTYKNKGFDWLIADKRSMEDMLPTAKNGGKLQVDQTFTGFLANPVTIASRGGAQATYSYKGQQDIYLQPMLSTDAAVIKAQKTVIGEFVTTLQRLPTPFELDRFSRRILEDNKKADYIRQVLTYKGSFSPSNQVAKDSILDRFYNHSTGEVPYAMAGLVDLKSRKTYETFADSFKQQTPYGASTLANIKEFGLYALSQLGNDGSLYGDIQMFLSPSKKLQKLLVDSFKAITEDPKSVKQAKQALNQSLAGDYTFPSRKGEQSSPLANGLNVESKSFKDSINKLSEGFRSDSPKIASLSESAHSQHSTNHKGSRHQNTKQKSAHESLNAEHNQDEHEGHEGYEMESRTKQGPAVHEFYDKITGNYQYSTSRDTVQLMSEDKERFRHEGIAFRSVRQGGQAVHRYYDLTNGATRYTLSQKRKERFDQNARYQYEGKDFYVYPVRAEQGTADVFRLFDTESKSDLYTTDRREAKTLLRQNPFLVDKGVAWTID